MRIKLFVVVLSFIYFVKPVFAGDPPILSNPNNNSTVTSSRLDWQAPSYELYSSNPFRVQVDDDSSFTSINKDYYTTNTHYTPTLSTGTWNWRIKAKDSSGTWSDWSNTWSFILADSISSPSPTPASTLAPTPTSIPSPTTPPSSSSFTISNIPSQISSDQSFTVTISLSLPNNQNTSLYLKGAFKKSDSSNYFGLTKVGSAWVKNSSSYSNQFPITTDSSGNWLGNLEVKADSEDSGFSGTSDYIFKVGRYTNSGLGPTWSNELTSKIISSSVDANQGTSSEEAVDSQSVSSDSLKSPTSITSRTTPNPKAVVLPETDKRIATIAGINSFASQSATPSSKLEVKNQKQINPFLLIGLGLIFAGTSSLGYIYFKRK